MSFSRRTKLAAAIAGTAALALIASGCTPSNEEGGEGQENITLTITTFGNFGYEGPNTKLYDEYEKLNQHVKIEVVNFEDGGSARSDVINNLATDGDLTDIVAFEEGWLGEIQQISNKFVDLRDFGADDISGNWLDWKVGQATDSQGRIIGYGTDIGPQGLSFRVDLFTEAGLATNRDEFAALLGGDSASWDQFFEVGRQYVAATGKPFYHNPAFIWNSFVNQQAEGYYKKDGQTLNVEGNETLKAFLGKLIQAQKDGLGAGLGGWGVGEQAKNDEFAVYVTPGWMLGVIESYYDAGTTDSGWDFADVFPGGATNWGGAWLGVSQQSEHQAEAAKLAAWLTAPEQQVLAFENAGPFPSTIKGAETLAAEATPRPFFNNAPVGSILANRAEGVVAQVKGPKDSIIQDTVFGAIMDDITNGNNLDLETLWAKALDVLKTEVG